MQCNLPAAPDGWRRQRGPSTGAKAVHVGRCLMRRTTVEELPHRGLPLPAGPGSARQPRAKAEAASVSAAGPSTAAGGGTFGARLQWRCGRLTAVPCQYRHPTPPRTVAAPWQRRRRAETPAVAAWSQVSPAATASADHFHRQAPAAVVDAAVAVSPPPQAGDGSPQPLHGSAPAGQPPPTPSNAIRYSARCLSGHAAIEQFFPSEVAAARSNDAGQRVRLHLRSSTDGQIHPYDVRIMPVYGRDKPCRLHGVSLLARDAGLQPGDTAELQRLPDGRVVLMPVARAAGTYQRRIAAPEPVVVTEYEWKKGLVHIPLPTMRLLLGTDATRSPAGTEVPVRVEDDGGGAATGANGSEGTGTAGPEQALDMVLRCYTSKGRRCPKWLLLGLGPLRARGAVAAGTQLFLAAERRASGVAAEHGAEGASCADATLIVNVGRPFRDGPETAVPAGALPCAGAVEESAGWGLGAGAGSSSVDGGETCGLPADDGAPAAGCGTLTLARGALLGMATLRLAFPDEVLQAQQSRTPQPVTLYARNQDGSLASYAAVIFPCFNPKFRCHISRIRALVGDLGLRQGDSVELLKRGAEDHRRVVVEVESAADPNTLRLKRSNLRLGNVIVPGRLASRLLGPSVAAQGAEEPGFPVRLHGPCGGVTGRAKPRMYSDLAPRRERYQWQVAGLRPWFLSLGAAPGDQVRLETVSCAEALFEGSSTRQPRQRQVVIAVTLLRAQAGAAGGGAEPAGAAAADGAAAQAAAACRGPVLHKHRGAGAAQTAPGKGTGVAQEKGSGAAGDPVGCASDGDGSGGEASCAMHHLTVDSHGLHLLGPAALRAAFPEQLAAALHTRDPQIVSVYRRLLDGRLQPYSVAVRTYDRKGTTCRLARCAALISQLGLRPGDQASLSVLPDGRHVLEPVSPVRLEPRVLRLTRRGVDGVVCVPVDVVSWLLGPDVATRGSGAAGIPVRVEAEHNDDGAGRAGGPRYALLRSYKGKPKLTWRLAQLTAWLRVWGAVHGDLLLLEREAAEPGAESQGGSDGGKGPQGSALGRGLVLRFRKATGGSGRRG